MSTRIKAIPVLLLLLMCSVCVMAQPDNTPGDPDVPVDGGLSILLATGIGYGVKKVVDAKRKKAAVNDAEA